MNEHPIWAVEADGDARVEIVDGVEMLVEPTDEDRHETEGEAVGVWSNETATGRVRPVVAYQRGMEMRAIEAIFTALEEGGHILKSGRQAVAVTARGGLLAIVDVMSGAGRAHLIGLAEAHVQIVRTVRASAGVARGCWRKRPADAEGVARYPVEINLGPQGRGGAGADVWLPVMLLADAAPPERRVHASVYPDDVQFREVDGSLGGRVRGTENAVLRAGVGDLVLVTEWMSGPDRDIRARLQGYATTPRPSTRPLVGILRSPAMGPGGRVLAEVGYDHETGYWVAPDPGLPTDFDDLPTDLASAKAAAARLMGYFEGVHFDDEKSRWAALAVVLAGVSRPAWSLAPAWLVRAPDPGSGKGSVTEIALRMGLGPDARVSLITWSTGTQDEMSKRISSPLAEHADAIVLDNVVGHLPNIPTISTALTAPQVEIRPLGEKQGVTVGTEGILWSANGNNISLGDDWPRRSITSYLRAPSILDEIERGRDTLPGGFFLLSTLTKSAEADRGAPRGAGGRRVSLPTRLEQVRRNRANILWDALTILAAAHAAREGTAARAWPPIRASYEAWSRVVRDAVWFVSGVDVAAGQDDLEGIDPQREADAAIMTALAEAVGEVAAAAPGVRDGFTLREIEAHHEASVEAGEAAFGAPPPAGGKPARSAVVRLLAEIETQQQGYGLTIAHRWRWLAKWLRRCAGRPLGGLMVKPAKLRDGNRVFLILKIGGAK